MKAKLYRWIVLASVCLFADSALAASSVTSEWTSPSTVTKDEVFNAAIVAGTEANYSLVSNDRTAGVISFRQERPGSSKKNYESLLNIRIRQDGDKVVVVAKTSGKGSLVSFVAGAALFKERLHNFHVYLFRELKITDEAQRQMMIKEE